MALSCDSGIPASEGEQARFFEIIDGAVVTISPYGGERDTLWVDEPLGSIVCMSSSYVACLSAVGCDSVVTGVSGLRFLSNGKVRAVEVGYDAAPDYERIFALKPDLVVAYASSALVPDYVSFLRSSGIPVLLLYDHLETHPLARASYVRLFGALTGRQEEADAFFAGVSDAYHSYIYKGEQRRKVLVNLPYGDRWFVPGGANWFTRLVEDAGGEVLGAEEGESASSVISLEKACALSREADVWLNPGLCRSREDILGVSPVFEAFDVPCIYNNIKRLSPGGGNDFWESGAVRPDLILSDLVSILQHSERMPLCHSERMPLCHSERMPLCHSERMRENLNYYIPVAGSLE